MNRSIRITVLLTLITLGAIGCKTTIIDPNTKQQATYRMGKLTVEESRDLTTVYNAAERAMSDLGLNVVSRVKDKLQAEIVARDAQDKKLTVKLLSLAKDRTEITIDASPMEKAQRIYESIHDGLGQM
jgi:cytidylate kinase